MRARARVVSEFCESGAARHARIRRTVWGSKRLGHRGVLHLGSMRMLACVHEGYGGVETDVEAAGE